MIKDDSLDQFKQKIAEFMCPQAITPEQYRNREKVKQQNLRKEWFSRSRKAKNTITLYRSSSVNAKALVYNLESALFAFEGS